MDAKDFKNVILFMANAWNENVAKEIWGEVMGRHFWSKWIGGGTKKKFDENGKEYEAWDPDSGTMRLFYDITPHNMQPLLDYIKKKYNGL